MPKKLSPRSDTLYKINIKIVLLLGGLLLLLVNCLFYHDFQDEVAGGIANVNRQLSIQRELLDEGMGLMFNSVYLQRSWVEEKLNSLSDSSVKDSLIEQMSYNPAANISSLDKHIPENKYAYGNFFIQGDLSRLDPKITNEIELMSNLFDLQRFLEENSSFATWSTYYSRDYIMIYPFSKTREVINEQSELFTAIKQAVDQLNNEKNEAVFQKGWETDIFLDHTGHIFMFSKNLPVLHEDEVIGIMAVNISVDDLENYIKKSGDLEVYVTDSGNNVLYCNGNKIESIQSLQKVFQEQYDINNIEGILNKDINPKISGRYFLSTELQNSQWRLIYVVPDTLIESPVPKRFVKYATANLIIIVGIVLICRLLSKYNKKAMEIARLKDEFLMTVSHDLKSPLSSIIGFNEMTANKLEETVFPALLNRDEKTNKAVERIRRNSSIIESEGLRLTELINNLLDLSVLENGEIVLKREAVHAEQILQDGFGAMQALIKSRGLDYFIETDPCLPSIFADRERIMQLLLNLLANAVKFTEKGFIKCSARTDHDMVLFCIEDSGKGISGKYQDSIFEKFITDETNSKTQKGTGLGLAICKNIVDRHGGKIWLESEAGKGSKFFFTIPVYQE